MMCAPETEYAFDKDLTLRLSDLQRPARTGIAKWNVRQIFGLVAIGIALIWLLPHLPNRFFARDVMHLTITLGVLGIWRFSWWFTHAVRAEIYRRVKFTKMHARASVVCP